MKSRHPKTQPVGLRSSRTAAAALLWLLLSVEIPSSSGSDGAVGARGRRGRLARGQELRCRSGTARHGAGFVQRHWEEKAPMHRCLFFPPHHHYLWLWEPKKWSVTPEAKQQINCSIRNRPSVFRFSSVDWIPLAYCNICLSLSFKVANTFQKWLLYLLVLDFFHIQLKRAFCAMFFFFCS